MPILPEADFAHAIVETIGAVHNFDLDAHEVNGQIAAVDFGKADGVFLSGNDGFSLAFFASVDGIKNLLLREAMVIGEAFGIDEFCPNADEVLLEALRLSDAAQGGNFARF